MRVRRTFIDEFKAKIVETIAVIKFLTEAYLNIYRVQIILERLLNGLVGLF